MASLMSRIFFFSSLACANTSRFSVSHVFSSNFRCEAIALQTACSNSRISSFLKNYLFRGFSMLDAL